MSRVVMNALSLCLFLCATELCGQDDLTLELAHANEIVSYEPLMVAFRLTNRSDTKVTIGREFQEMLRIERRKKGDVGEWATVWMEEASLLKMQGMSESLVFPVGQSLSAGNSVTWHRWVFWRDPVAFGGHPFVFDEPGEYEIRASLAVPVYRFPQGSGATRPVTTLSSPSEIAVKVPSEEDKRALRYITHWKLVSLDKYDEVTLADVANLLPESSLADFCNYCAALYELRQLSKEYKDDRRKLERNMMHARDAGQFCFKISDRNRLLRERGALYLLLARRNNSDLSKAFNLAPIRETLAAADFLATDFFHFGGRRSLARYLHEQELMDYRDDRLDVEYMAQPTEDDTRETLVQRLAAESGVGLRLAAVPQELKDAGPGRLVQNPRQTLRAFLNFQRPQDWYWVRDGDGYALEFREPSFSGK